MWLDYWSLVARLLQNAVQYTTHSVSTLNRQDTLNPTVNKHVHKVQATKQHIINAFTESMTLEENKQHFVIGPRLSYTNFIHAHKCMCMLWTIMCVCVCVCVYVWWPSCLILVEEWSMEDKVIFEQAFRCHGKNFQRIRSMVSNGSLLSLSLSLSLSLCNLQKVSESFFTCLLNKSSDFTVELYSAIHLTK